MTITLADSSLVISLSNFAPAAMHESVLAGKTFCETEILFFFCSVRDERELFSHKAERQGNLHYETTVFWGCMVQCVTVCIKIVKLE